MLFYTLHCLLKIVNRRKINWFEFEVHRPDSIQKVSLPGETYKDALYKIQRIHSGATVSLVRKWTQAEQVQTPNASYNASSKPEQEPRQAPSPSQPKMEETPFWEILEVPKEATLTEIKKAYLQKLKDYHPDRVADMGPEIKQLAEQKTSQIVKAFNEAQKIRNG